MPRTKKATCCVKCDCAKCEKVQETIMFEYVRDPDTKEKIGVLYSDVIDGEIAIGFSVCHKPDVFDADRGMKIAIGRAIAYVDKKFNRPLTDRQRVFIPAIMYPAFIKYIERCQHYYKDKSFCEWIDCGFYMKVDLSHG